MNKESKKHYDQIKVFHTFMYDYILHRERKHFCCYYLQDFRTEKSLKCNAEYCFNINGK